MYASLGLNELTWTGTTKQRRALLLKFATGYVLLKLANYFKTLRPRRNRQHFADNIPKGNFFNESALIEQIKSLKFVGTTNNIVALVQIIAWSRPSDTLLFEPVIVSLLTHICVIQPQWIYNAYLQTVAYWNVSCLCLKHNIFKMKAGAFFSTSSLRSSSAPSHQPGHFVKKDCSRDVEPWLSSWVPEH